MKYELPVPGYIHLRSPPVSSLNLPCSFEDDDVPESPPVSPSTDYLSAMELLYESRARGAKWDHSIIINGIVYRIRKSCVPSPCVLRARKKKLPCGRKYPTGLGWPQKAASIFVSLDISE
ncbi:hypothetical protein MDAP_002243 [Mitosporidium daphniae]|uniref:Uncharacterized protein n=1 Tax=Mitosporidium daphniae TaxID=1485682 RepID=A0A098VTB2_9MICR|nr:uncharacterized protein DI09_4p140 [Mitosporidium daphniae]KGG50931.1 hypothetical protein DI09_4p140 [Mitosporidium daphniae]|eukprot:XP_013237358.1 uncharacterized protein DI09_4p140 [Mitosporidium daphniae]